jgi:hypothetical protein
MSKTEVCQCLRTADAGDLHIWRMWCNEQWRESDCVFVGLAGLAIEATQNLCLKSGVLRSAINSARIGRIFLSWPK